MMESPCTGGSPEIVECKVRFKVQCLRNFLQVLFAIESVSTIRHCLL